MIFWILVVIVTAVACAALYYASAGRAVNAAPSGAEAEAMQALHRSQLAEIEADMRAGRLSEADGLAAKAELAREVLRQRRESAPAGTPSRERQALPLALLFVAVLAIGTYSVIGNPELQAQPLATRPRPEPQLDLAEAVARIEAQLAKTPDDLRGWTVIAPAYVQMGRYPDAVRAYRRINELGPVTADSETDLAEAMLLAAGGQANADAIDLFRSAAARDPRHVRSRFYLAGEATRAGDFAAAVPLWKDVIALGTPEDPWLASAREGLAAAEAGLSGGAAPAQPAEDPAIRAMVDGLDARLRAEGGPIEDWTRLVRSYVVLGDMDRAQETYDAARAAYPSATDRADLDGLAASAGLDLSGDKT